MKLQAHNLKLFPDMVTPLSQLVPKNFNAAKFILAAKPWANFAKTGRMVVGIGRNYALHAKA